MSSINDGESSGSTSNSTALSAMLDWTSIILELQEKIKTLTCVPAKTFETTQYTENIKWKCQQYVHYKLTHTAYHTLEFFKITNEYKKRRERE